MNFHSCSQENQQKTAATRAALFDSSMHQIVCRLGLRPDPGHWGSLQHSPDLAGFKGPYFYGDGRAKGKDGKGIDVKKTFKNIFLNVKNVK